MKKTDLTNSRILSLIIALGVMIAIGFPQYQLEPQPPSQPEVELNSLRLECKPFTEQGLCLWSFGDDYFSCTCANPNPEPGKDPCDMSMEDMKNDTYCQGREDGRTTCDPGESDKMSQDRQACLDSQNNSHCATGQYECHGGIGKETKFMCCPSNSFCGVSSIRDNTYGNPICLPMVGKPWPPIDGSCVGACNLGNKDNVMPTPGSVDGQSCTHLDADTCSEKGGTFSGCFSVCPGSTGPVECVGACINKDTKECWMDGDFSCNSEKLGLPSNSLEFRCGTSCPHEFIENIVDHSQEME